MGHLCELFELMPPPRSHAARPGPVRRLAAKIGNAGRLVLEWRPAAGADRYRIERTREGRHYELLGETQGTWFCHREIVWRDPWFYRVIAVNSRGCGRAKIVWFFERRGKGGDLLLPIPVRPGLRITIGTLVPE